MDADPVPTTRATEGEVIQPATTAIEAGEFTTADDDMISGTGFNQTVEDGAITAKLSSLIALLGLASLLALV